MQESLLKIINLSIAFNTGNGAVDAVKDANLVIYPGQTVSIVGESGSGKSTLASAIIKLLPNNANITSGEIIFEGNDIVTLNEKNMVKLRGGKIGWVPQNPMSHLNPVLSIGFQVKEALAANINKGMSKKFNNEVIEILQNAGIGNAIEKINQYPHELSGGLKQRVLIAMAMACKPKLLIADEPTSALDVTVQKNIMDFIVDIIKSFNTSMLFITHDLNLAAKISDVIAVMYQGRIVESGNALKILRSPQHPYTKKLIDAIPSILDNKIFTTSNKNPNAIIKVCNVTKEFSVKAKKNKFLALDNISFAVKQGQTLAVVGESGSGKSTLVNIILNLISPTSGKIFYQGQDIALFKRKQLFNLRRKMQVVFQNPYGSLDPMYTIYKSIEEPLVIHKIGNKQQRLEKVSQLLKLVHLPPIILNRFPNELSGGQRQRVAIARALSLDPEILILDEAVSALDVLIQNQILQLLHDIQTKFDLTYIFITHNLAVVRQIADEVMVIKEGKIVEFGSNEEIFQTPQHKYTKNLLASVPSVI